VVQKLLTSMALRTPRPLYAIGRDPVRVGGSASGLPGAAQPIAVQPVPDRIPVHAQLLGDLGERPRLPGHAVSQIGVQADKAELGGTLFEPLVSGPAPLTGAADLPRRALDAGLVNESSMSPAGTPLLG
jgi:hypothetical protein